MENIETIKLDYYTDGKFKSLEPFKNAIKSSKTVLITFDNESNHYTAHLNEKSGPIITDENKEILISKFKDALLYCFAIEAFIVYCK